MRLGIPKAHCECVVVQDWISRRNSSLPPIVSLPSIGASQSVCGTCSYFLEAVFEHVYKQSWEDRDRLMDRMVPGRSYAFWPCTVPEQSPELVKKAVAEMLLRKLSGQLTANRVQDFLQRQLRRAGIWRASHQNRDHSSDDSSSDGFLPSSPSSGEIHNT